MVVETAQLLSTAHKVLDEVPKHEELLYRKTHHNHPCAKWCRENKENYTWLYELLIELCCEYTRRYKRVHKCEASGLLDVLANFPQNLEDGEFTEPPQAMPDEFKVEGNSVRAYRRLYRGGKAHLAKWQGKLDKPCKPSWY
jgi:hypothetical protein